MHSKQRTFDLIVAHLRKQRVPALRKVTLLNGFRTVGTSLLPNHLYNPEFEGLRTSSDNRRLLDVLHILGHDIELVQDFEIVHDTVSPNYWERHFRQIAAKHKLTYKKA